LLEAHICVAFGRVNRVFCTYVAISDELLGSRRAPSLRLDRKSGSFVQGSKMLISLGFPKQYHAL